MIGKCALDLAIKALERPQVVLFAENTTEEEKQKLVAELKAVMDKAKLTAEPERTKGEWKPFNSYYRKCDKCERMVGFDYADPEHGNWFNFCPNCGADMRGNNND